MATKDCFGTTKADYERNIEAYRKVTDWFEEALENPELDPLERQTVSMELFRIYDQEMNPSYSPEAGKRSPGPFNISNILANLTGNSLQFTMQKIGGRAALQEAAIVQARSEAMRRAAEVRHELQYPLQKSILEAMKVHTITQSRWVKEVAEPILASYNSIGSRQIRAGDTTRYGHRVSGADMAAVRKMKEFTDAMNAAAQSMDLHTAKMHPILIRERLSGREILRPQQGGTELIVPRRFNEEFINLIKPWRAIRNNRSIKDSLADLIAYVQTGAAFNDMLLAHIYSTQRYPDYDNRTQFSREYREIYNRIIAGNPPSSFNDVVDTVFNEQSGTC